ncbi:hypothetical protein UlMin_000872 [Ulmus minor]
MGKSLPSTDRIFQFAKTISQNLRNPKRAKPISPNPAIGEKSKRLRLRKEMETESSSEKVATTRLPLSEVVSDCVKRWFKDTLKEAKTGDINMQVLVGQMYYSGYGVPRDAQKGRIWITRASRTRSSVWKVSDKRPGYNASDSDSDEPKDDS